MSDALYERYKDALRRGHVAALRSNHAKALEAYGEAARIAPDRALPFVGIGGVLSKLGKTTDALAAYDAALERAPGDEAALRGRADVLAISGDRVGAAAALDQLAAILEDAGRWPDATDAAGRALELAESRSRRSTVTMLIVRLREIQATDPDAVAAIRRAEASLGADAIDRSPVAPSGDGAPLEPAEPPEPPFDPVATAAEIEAALDEGDTDRIRDVALAAAAGYRAGDQPGAAIDACSVALAARPDDPAVHLALAGLYLDRGWRAPAVEKLVLLDRLARLTDDDDTHQRLCAIVSVRLADEPRLRDICA